MPWSLIALIVVALVVFVLVARSGKAKGGRGAERELVRMVHGDRATADRLIRAELAKDPSRSRERAAAVALRKLERDRGR